MSNAVPAAACCCAPECVKDCIHGNAVGDSHVGDASHADILWGGCCHKSDTLLLWNERPGYSNTQHYFQGDDCEICYTVSQPAMEAVQSIYHYHSCRFRFIYPPTPHQIGETLVDFPQGDSPLGTGCPDPVCENEFCTAECCNDNSPFDPGNCQCNAWFGVGKGGLSTWRRHKMVRDPDKLWFIETACHKGGNPLDATHVPAIGRLGSDILALVFFERWWKIAECDEGVRIKVPGCTLGASSNCSGVSFQTDDLVPEWWIYACAGIPLYRFELDEALEFGIIDSGEYDEIIDAIEDTPQRQPPQPPLMKMAKAGYLVAKDWRKEQKEAFEDLEIRFPGQGYAPCVESLDPLDDQMDELGPFRKRYTAPFASQIARPWLHKDDVIPELNDFPAFGPDAGYQAKCMINYPGSWTNAKDYQFWRERQWVYFRGIPGGWNWVSWGYTEEQIADGLGRNEGTGDPNVGLTAPLEAFRGEPRPQVECSDCGDALCPDRELCEMCPGGIYNSNNCEDCGDAPIAACDPPLTCLRFNVFPICEGAHFVFSQYTAENDLTLTEGGCEQSFRYKCHFQVNSFLVEAQRSMDSWDDSIPYRCRREDPPLPVFNDWPVPEDGHLAHEEMCADIILNGQNAIYDEDDFCCHGKCIGSTNVYHDGNYPCPGIIASPGPGDEIFSVCPSAGPTKMCEVGDQCPPHDDAAQIACIGHELECEPDP